MNRVEIEGDDIAEEVKKTEYPFVPNEDGPVELQKFFGY